MLSAIREAGSPWWRSCFRHRVLAGCGRDKQVPTQAREPSARPDSSYTMVIRGSERQDLMPDPELFPIEDAQPAEAGGAPTSSYDEVEVTPLPVEQVGEPLEPGSLAGAKLAIIIDDLGGAVTATPELMQLRAPLTVAIMPGVGHAEEEARAAAESGFAVLLHQPMEPLDGSVSPGPGAITVGMTPDEIRSVLQYNLSKVPGAVGVNNHMGSKVTEDSEIMEVVLHEVFARGLFFIDSRTSSNSVVADVAEAMGASVLENSTFLDGVNTEEYVIEQIRSAAKKAHLLGQAVAIGHVRPATIRALKRMIPELEKAGVTLVTVDQIAPPIPDELRTPSLPAQPSAAAEEAEPPDATEPVEPEPPESLEPVETVEPEHTEEPSQKPPEPAQPFEPDWRLRREPQA